MVEDNYTFYDHEAPEWATVIPFCQSVHEWLTKDSKNVAIIHCKAGKGRTGTFIAAYMLYAQMFKSATQSLTHYAETRTLNKKGVTIPSQKRYVYYLDTFVSNNSKTPFKNQKLKLKSIKLQPAPLFKSEGITFEIQDFHKNVLLDFVIFFF
jgi:phosphatidylinositol-3,4,5-trisphosphate 3-phosphatase and dual-specificity protein phosphatase PTEN